MIARMLAAVGAVLAQAALGAGYLPDDQSALAAIDALPAVQVAVARAAEADSRGEALRYPPYDLNLQIMPTARHTTPGPAYAEGELSLSRTLRLPNKARLDRAIGDAGANAARYGLADARHLGARLLLDYWWAWLRAAATATQAERQAAILAEERRMVMRRVNQGDAAQLDLDRADAALAAAQSALVRATSAREQARLAMSTWFPALPVPTESPAIPTPPAAKFDIEASVQRILAASHEIAAADALAERQRLNAERALADRIPDPTVGMRIFDEANGVDQGVGVFVSIPFPSARRAATATAELQAAAAARAAAAAVTQNITAAARQLLSGLPGRFAAWKAAQRALAASDAVLARTLQGWQLGEVTFSDLAIARRQQQDSAALELNARLDAQEARLRWEIDSHSRWAHEDADVVAADGHQLF